MNEKNQIDSIYWPHGEIYFKANLSSFREQIGFFHRRCLQFREMVRLFFIQQKIITLINSVTFILNLVESQSVWNLYRFYVYL